MGRKKSYTKVITDEDMMFAELLVLKGLNQSDAYRKSYKYTGNNASVLGNKVKNKKVVKEYIADLEAIRAEDAKLDCNYIIHEYKNLFNDPDTPPAVKKGILDSLAKANGMFIEKTVNVNLDNDISRMSDEELEAEISKMKIKIGD